MIGPELTGEEVTGMEAKMRLIALNDDFGCLALFGSQFNARARSISRALCAVCMQWSHHNKQAQFMITMYIVYSDVAAFNWEVHKFKNGLKLSTKKREHTNKSDTPKTGRNRSD